MPNPEVALPDKGISVASELERKFADDTSVRFYYRPSLRGMLALNAHDPAKAVTILKATASYELGSPRSSLLVPFGSLYSVYVRGLAYLALRQGDKAVAEFEKIVCIAASLQAT